MAAMPHAGILTGVQVCGLAQGEGFSNAVRCWTVQAFCQTSIFISDISFKSNFIQPGLIFATDSSDTRPFQSCICSVFSTGYFWSEVLGLLEMYDRYGKGNGLTTVE